VQSAGYASVTAIDFSLPALQQCFSLLGGGGGGGVGEGEGEAKIKKGGGVGGDPHTHMQNRVALVGGDLLRCFCFVFFLKTQLEVFLKNKCLFDIPPKNGVIALWPNTRVVKCKYCVSQKRNEANKKNQWVNVLLTFIFQFTARS